MAILDQHFYQRDDVVQIARELLGQKLCTRIGGVLTSGLITETEAYCGRRDRACHAFGGRRTARTEVMYAAGGVAYVYLCYGVHEMFNIVTHQAGYADAVLIRAVEPVDGLAQMLVRRGHTTLSPRLSAGPGALTQALGIGRSQNGWSLLGDMDIWIETAPRPADDEIIATTRIGIAYAGEDAGLPWRFYWDKSMYVSRRP